MKTVKLYDDNAYLTEFDAVVLSCEKADGGFDVLLDKTAFFPEEGGQSCDTGTLGSANVLQVRIDGDRIIHTVDREISGEVCGRIDWEPRFDKMQQHTGEHIVSGLVYKMYGYHNVGFHLGGDDVTFDFDGMLTRAQLDEIELMANEAVYKNVDIKAYYPDDLSAIDYRSKSELSGDVRIVEIVGVDMCACCAPHVAKTGEVGIIKLLEAQSYKGGVRVHLACGNRAVRDYQIKFENLGRIAATLSSGKNNAAEFFERYVNETNALKQSISLYKKDILALKSQLVQKSEGNIVIFEDGMDGGMLRNFINELSGKYGRVCAVMSARDDVSYNFVAASDAVAMRDVADKMKQQLNARAGGSDKMIQGTVCASAEDIKNFFEAL